MEPGLLSSRVDEVMVTVAYACRERCSLQGQSLDVSILHSFADSNDDAGYNATSNE